jgi:hypothetical protein
LAGLRGTAAGRALPRRNPLNRLHFAEFRLQALHLEPSHGGFFLGFAEFRNGQERLAKIGRLNLGCLKAHWDHAGAHFFVSPFWVLQPHRPGWLVGKERLALPRANSS